MGLSRAQRTDIKVTVPCVAANHKSAWTESAAMQQEAKMKKMGSLFQLTRKMAPDDGYWFLGGDEKTALPELVRLNRPQPS